MTLASPWTGPSCASNAGFAPMATPALDLLAVRTESGHVRLDDRSAHWDGAVEPALAALGGHTIGVSVNSLLSQVLRIFIDTVWIVPSSAASTGRL